MENRFVILRKTLIILFTERLTTHVLGHMHCFNKTNIDCSSVGGVRGVLA